MYQKTKLKELLQNDDRKKDQYDPGWVDMPLKSVTRIKISIQH